MSQDCRPAGHFHDLQSIKALVHDPELKTGSAIKDRLIDVGLRGIGACAEISGLGDLVREKQPDLLALDLDKDCAAVCKVIQDIRSQAIKTDNPFLVILGITADDGRDTVAAALDAGVDVLLAKPVSTAALRACLRDQIEHRAEFIATADYVGPDRRPADREPSDEELVSVEVPNTLQQKATGQETDEPVEDRIARTMRSLGAQRSWHLARKIGALAENARRAVESGVDFPLLGECVEAIDDTLTKIETLDAELGLDILRGVVASTRAALETLGEAGDQVTARHFELLRVHSYSVGVALEEDDSVRGVLVTELGRAVSAVRNSLLDAGRRGAEAPRGGGYSWQVRLRAWWDGVDPREVVAAGQ